MRAVVLEGLGDVRIQEIDAPSVRDDQVAVRVAHSGICGSDLALIHHYGVSSSPHPLTGAFGPQILGHEFSGVVESVGPRAEGFAVGDRVVAQPTYWCGTCPPCTRGLTHLCQTVAFHGINAAGGGLSEVTVLPAASLHLLPDRLSLAQGALIEPLAVARHAVVRGEVDPVSFALVLGAGPIGISVALNLKAVGVERIVITDTSQSRRAIARHLGFSVLDPAREDVAAAVLGMTQRAGADAVFECAGAAATVETAMSCIAARGRVIVLGVHKSPVRIDSHLLMTSEAAILSSLAYSREDFEAVIELSARGAFPLDRWVEHISLDQVPEVIADLSAGMRMKVLVDLY